MRKLVRWLNQSQPDVLNIGGGLGAAVCGAGLQENWDTWWFAPWLVGLTVAVVLPAVSSRRNRLNQTRQAARNCIKNALTACGAAHGHPSQHVRANIMLVSDDGLSRVVDAATAFNMSSDPDCDLRIDANAGVSGEAFRSRVAAYGDLALALQPGGPTWGLSGSQMAKVRTSLKSILSVPIFDPDEPTGQLLGTLQVDSDRTIAEMEFDQPGRHAVVERFSDVIALLLKEGR